MGEGDGGIILYLLQEGRGIGLTNKIRAYALKDSGMDTVDANEELGFDDDERAFQPAVEMLKQLGIKQVKILSNNPRKSKNLTELGIKVTSTIPHIMPVHKHNEHYLKTKAHRLGHKIPKT
jgi:GTP cyclohydrolase II